MVTHDVEEALDLADRVLVFSPRPATIRESLSVPFPHPRPLRHPSMLELKRQILQGLGMEDSEDGTASMAPADFTLSTHAQWRQSLEPHTADTELLAQCLC